MASVPIRGGTGRLTGAPPDEPESTPASPRREDVVHPSQSNTRTLDWRAIVRVRDRDRAETEWHAAACGDPSNAAAHCPEGRQQIERYGQPDGHCLVDGRCARCAPEPERPVRGRRKTPTT